jgi:hypothetical protein
MDRMEPLIIGLPIVLNTSNYAQTTKPLLAKLNLGSYIKKDIAVLQGGVLDFEGTNRGQGGF